MFKNPIFLFVLAVAVFWAFLPSYTKLQDLKQTNLDYEARIAELNRENTELKEEKRRLIEDPEYLEKVAREKMGLIKEGETVYRIVQPEEPR